MKNIEEKVETLIEPIIQGLGYVLYDVEYAKDGKDYYLRVFIDSKKGISLEDCEKVSNAINDILDREDLVKEQYFLEVSSPGIERVLKKDKHFEKNIGKEVLAKLFKPQNGIKQISGTLEDFDKDNILIKTDDKTIKIERKNIAGIKTVYNWN